MRPILFLLLAPLACSGTPKEAQPAEVPAPAEPVVDKAAAEAEALDRAQGGIQRAGKALKGRLQDAMAQGGPVSAVSVCADEATGLTALASGRDKVRVGRASLKPRNPRNTGPDWVQAWLAEAQQQADQGVELSAIAGLSEVVQTPEGPEAHVIKPIGTEGLCLSCHGSPEQIPGEVQAVLAERYPDDKATGYEAGQLRGAFWAVAPVDLGG